MGIYSIFVQSFFLLLSPLPYFRQCCFHLLIDMVVYKYGLYISRVAGKILNIKTTLISKMYNKLPIKSREDIDIKSSDIVDLYGEGKIIGDTYKLLESEILKKRLKNNTREKTVSCILSSEDCQHYFVIYICFFFLPPRFSFL